MELARPVHRVVDGRITLDPAERLDHLRRPRIEPADMASVEDLAGGGILGVTGRPRLLMPPERRLDLGRQVGPQPVCLGDEVRERGSRVGEHE